MNHAFQTPPSRLALGVLLLFAAGSVAAQQCGGEGQPACTVSPAAYVGQKPGGCPAGSFFDLIDGGTCWSCPEGYNRSVTHVKSGDACVRPAYEQFSRATRHGRATGLIGTDCPRGQFWDPNGYCWSCPSGFGRTAYAVTDARACARGVPAAVGSARLVSNLACPSGSFFDLIDGGTCWRCPQGYVRTLSHVKAGDACAANLVAGMAPELGSCGEGLVNIGGSCSRRGACGGNGQRPCLIGERVPSCDENLREDFKNNRCVPLQPGETPFTAGLVSLTDFYSDGLRAACAQIAGAVRIPSDTDLAVGANCSKDILAGVACGFVVDKYLGGGVADTAGAMLGSGATAVQFQQAIDSAYAGKCSRFAERLSPATRHGRGAGLLGTDCSSGQFWDPNGYCYSCPQDFTRTLNPVDSEGACVDQFGGELLRVACSVQEGVSSMFVAPAACSVEMLQGGLIEGARLDFARASQDVCMATGEFVYTFIDAVQYARDRSKQSAEKMQSSLRTLVSKIQNSQAYQRTAAGATAAGVALSGADLVQKLNQFRSCDFIGPGSAANRASAPAGPPPLIKIFNRTDSQVQLCIRRAFEPIRDFARGESLRQAERVGCDSVVIHPGQGVSWEPAWNLSGRPVRAHYLEMVLIAEQMTSSVCEIRDTRAARWEIQPAGSGAASCLALPDDGGIGGGDAPRRFGAGLTRHPDSSPPPPPPADGIDVSSRFGEYIQVCMYQTFDAQPRPLRSMHFKGCSIVAPGQKHRFGIGWVVAGNPVYAHFVEIQTLSPRETRRRLVCEMRDKAATVWEVHAPAAGGGDQCSITAR